VLPPLLADANIAVQVVAFLRGEGVDVVSIVEMGWAARTDDEILAEATRTRRFVLTHDSDFGRLAIAEGKPYVGVLRLRPGDDPPAMVIGGLRRLLARDTDWTPPVIAVYEAGRLRIRRPPR
jgi:predicted nuclease of predicted toxin-antitoxin system